MANLKGFIKNSNGDIILPISRGELIFDSKGNIALHSEEFKATKATRDTTKNIVSGGEYGLVSPEDLLALEEAIAKIKDIEAQIGGDSGSGSLSSALKELVERVGYKKGDTYTNDKGESTEAKENSGVYEYVDDKVQNYLALSDALRFKGTLGTEGQITSLPKETINNGDTYKVVSRGNYDGLEAKKGDLIIAVEQDDKTFKWELVPSGDEDETFIQIGDGGNALSGTIIFKGDTGINIKESDGIVTISATEAAAGELSEQVEALNKTVNGYTAEDGTEHPGLVDKTNAALGDIADAVTTYEDLIDTEGEGEDKTLVNGDKLVKVQSVYGLVQKLLEHIELAATTYLQANTFDLTHAFTAEELSNLTGKITNK